VFPPFFPLPPPRFPRCGGRPRFFLFWCDDRTSTFSFFCPSSWVLFLTTFSARIEAGVELLVHPFASSFGSRAPGSFFSRENWTPRFFSLDSCVSLVFPSFARTGRLLDDSFSSFSSPLSGWPPHATWVPFFFVGLESSVFFGQAILSVFLFSSSCPLYIYFN